MIRITKAGIEAVRLVNGDSKKVLLEFSTDNNCEDLMRVINNEITVINIQSNNGDYVEIR